MGIDAAILAQVRARVREKGKEKNAAQNVGFEFCGEGDEDDEAVGKGLDEP